MDWIQNKKQALQDYLMHLEDTLQRNTNQDKPRNHLVEITLGEEMVKTNLQIDVNTNIKVTLFNKNESPPYLKFECAPDTTFFLK